MRAIEFRYVVKFVYRMKDGTIISEGIKSNVFSIETIEDDNLDESLTGWLLSELGTGYGTCEILARQQYTELKDAKGNKIFEGDIIQGYWNEYYPDAIGKIVFKDGKFQGVFKLDVSTGITSGTALAKNYTVIGNKYQHGELLNEQKTANTGTDRDG